MKIVVGGSMKYRNLIKENTAFLRNHRSRQFNGTHCVLCQSIENLQTHHPIPKRCNSWWKDEYRFTLCQPCHRIIENYLRIIAYEYKDKKVI